MKIRLTLLLLALLLNGCALTPGKDAEKLLASSNDIEQGITRLTQAAKEHPDAIEYRTLLTRTLERHVAEQVWSAQEALKAGNFDAAEARFRNALRYHPENAQAQAGQAAVESGRRNLVLLQDAEAAYKKGEFEAARSLLRAILAKAPDHAQASRLLAQVDAKIGKSRGVEFPQLAVTYRRPITLQFKDVPIKSMFDAISRQSGLNFIFDKDVRADQRSTVFAKDTALADVLEMLLATSQLSRKVLNANTLLIYPNTPVKQKDYQDMVVKSFFLSNANAKDTMNLIRSMAKIKDVYIDERLNMVAVRDAPETVALAEKLVNMTDRPEPEVMMQVEILEVKRSRLLDLGVQWPNQFTLLGKEELVTPVFDQFGTKVGETKSYTDAPMTVDLLKHIRGSNVGISPTPAITARKDEGDVNILANPRIRVRNKEKAKIHIGDKVPVITSNVTSTGVTSESVSYLDVGLKLDVEPQVYLDGEVAIKVGLEVSNIVQQVKSANGTLTYQLGSRNANTVLRLQDGETQVLAGLISDEERSAASKVPGLGDIPLLGRLFSTQRDDKSKTEIVLLITPRILRNIIRPELAEAEFFAGTESNASDQPLRLRPVQRIAPPSPASQGQTADQAQEAAAEQTAAEAGQPQEAPAATP